MSNGRLEGEAMGTGQRGTAAPFPVDWRRLAEPQPDQYDTAVILRFAETSGYVRRQPPPDAPRFLGTITIESGGPPLGTDSEPAPAGHANIGRAGEALDLWPTLREQCQRLLDTVAVYVDLRDARDNVVGSTCGPGSRGFGSIASTVNNHVGFAEAIVHELAHHKLRALGVDVDSARRLISNAPADLYPSPIRYDTERPMTAVLHAQYSYCHVAALDCEIVRAARDVERDRSVIERSLAAILPKLEFGRAVVESCAETDVAGAAFLAGLSAWTDRILDDGFACLREFGVAPLEFRHPLAARILVDAERGSGRAAAVKRTLILSTDAAHPRRPLRRADVECHAVSDGMVLYCPSQDAAYSLNGSSREIWELCDGRRTSLDIARALAQRLGLADDAEALQELLSDVVATLRQLEADSLLHGRVARP